MQIEFNALSFSKLTLLMLACLLIAVKAPGQTISETAGTTTTVMVNGGEIFADPNDGINGGLGGDCAETNTDVPGNYPNCDCITVTTLCATAGNEVSVDFTSFRVFGVFDWLAIYDGNSPVTGSSSSGNASNPTSDDDELWNSSVDGDNLSSMSSAGMTTFTSTGGCLTFASRFSSVVNTCGWEANVTTVPALCSITNLVVDNLRCGDGFNSDDAYADVSFDVVDGSGDYSVRVQEAGTTMSTNGNSIIGETMNGTINSGAQLTVGNVSYGEMAEIFVVDVTNGSCVSNVVTVTVPTCPPCPPVGGLVISEVMQNPMAVLDSEGEYIEVYNTTTEQINMKNMVISDDDGESHTIALDVLVNPGGYVVLARNADMTANGGFSADYEYTGFQLANTSDEVILSCQGTVIDRVAYDNGATFPDPNGASMQLNSGSIDATANDDGSNWCESTTPYGDGDLGTPGSANVGCNEPPVAVCMDITVDANAGCQATVVAADFDEDSSDPDGDVLTFSIDPAGPFDLGTTTVALTVSDGEFSHTCQAIITVVDNTPPSISCVDDMDLSTDPGECGAVVTFELDAADNCPENLHVTTDPVSGSFFPVGTTTVTATATDAAGNNNQCTFDVTVNDAEAPVINCVAEIFVNNDPGVCESTIDLPAPEPTDNCGVVTFEYRYVEVDENNNELGDFTLFTDVTAGATITLPIGRYRIRFRAFDAANNIAGCNQFVTVTDNEAPVITACAGSTVNFNGEESFNSEDVIDFAVTDNCEIASIVYDPPLINCEDLGTTVTVTITVVDAVGNNNSCTADVLVDGIPCGFMDFGEDGIGCEDSNEVNYDVPSESFTLESDGCYTTNFTQDNAAYVKTEMCGDGEIIAHITSIDPLGQGWAGITMRESEAPGAKKVELLVNLSSLIRRAVRTTTNGYAFPAQFFRPGATWLKLVRTGNQFLGYASTNGTNWQLVLGAAVPMNSCIQAGLMVTNYSANGIVAGTFDNVEVSGTGNMNLQIPNTDHHLPEATPLQDFTFFPNPATSEVQVDLSAFSGQEAVLRIFNQVGQVMVQSRIEEATYNTEKIDLSHLPSGAYFLEVISGEYRQVKKLLKTGLFTTDGSY
ncbi:MAG: hypothetical protein DHS20C18_18420 [Saprospiraceae bacterium]|nr:MAG: hypothetical protein DHS20C18_18420 [Saprospiraceae bacterium]